MHGLGNDFVMLSAEELARLVEAATVADQAHSQSRDAVAGAACLESFCGALATRLCNRHFSIGGDGLIIAINLTELKKQIEDSDFYRALDQFTASYPQRDQCQLAWIYINSDGSYSAMCGNGLRCFTLFARELGWLEVTAKVATSAYPVEVTITKELDTAPGGGLIGAGGLVAVEVLTRLAGPVFAPAEIPLDTSDFQSFSGLNSFVDQNIDIHGTTLAVTCLSMGNPHCVVFEQESIAAALDEYVVDIKAAHANGLPLQNFPRRLLVLAADIQQLSLFPQGVNVEFVAIDKNNGNTALVFVVERGCGATLACASGAAAVLAAGVISGRLNKKSYVILPGGKLEVSLSSVHNQEYIELTGPAIKAFSGDVTLPLSIFASKWSALSGGKTSSNSSARSGEGLFV